MIRSLCHLSWRLVTNDAFRFTLLVTATLGSYLFFYHHCALTNAADNFLDLPSFHAASVAVFRDHLSPYDVGRLTRINGLEFRTYPFLYPPPILLIFKPLATLSLDQTKYIATALNHFILIPTLLLIPTLILKLSPRHDYWRFSLCLLYPLYSFPLILTVQYGQVNIALLATLVGFWIAIQRGQSLLAGLFLCGAIVCKTIPLLFIPMLLVTGRWRVCAHALLFLALACVLSFLSLPGGTWGDWLFRIAPSGGYMNEPFGLFSPAGPWNQGLNGVVARIVTSKPMDHLGFQPKFLGKILGYCCALGVITLSAFALRRARHSTQALNLLCAVTLPLIFLTAPFSWEHHIVYLLPSLLFALCHRMTGSMLWRIPVFTAAIFISITFTTPALMFYRFSSVLSLWIVALVITWKHGGESEVTALADS
jgi:hypothetical protein